MARRAAHIKKHHGNFKDQKLLQLDAGGFANFYAEDGPLKTETLVNIYGKIDIDAVNITSRELGFNAEKFETLTSKVKTPYISSNIVDSNTGIPRYETVIQLERNEKRIAIIGVTNKVIKTWELSDGTILATEDPIESVKPIVEKVRDEADLVILLAHMPRRKLIPLVEAVPGIDFVFAGDGYSLTREPIKVGNTYISYAGKQGQYLGSMRVKFTDNGPELVDHEMVLLTLDMPEDPEIKAKVDEALAKIEKLKADDE